MKKGIVIGIFLALLLVMPMVSAIQTEVELYTLPLHEVFVFILGAGSTRDSLYHPGPITPGEDGLVSLTFDVEPSEVGIEVLVKLNGETIGYDRLDNFDTGGKQVIYYLVDELGVVPDDEGEKNSEDNKTITEEPVEGETSEEENVDVDSTSGVTGNVVSNVGSFLSRSKYYLVGIVAALLIIGVISFFVIKIPHLMKGTGNTYKTDDKPATILVDKELEDAERKIKEAEREIKDIRERKSKMSMAERKFEEAKEELEKIKREEGED